MLEPKTLSSNKLYIFRGQQLRYSHPSSCKVQSRYVFIDSKGKRKELGALFVRRELQETTELAEKESG
jgi:hypothetical protein